MRPVKSPYRFKNTYNNKYPPLLLLLTMQLLPDGIVFAVFVVLCPPGSPPSFVDDENAEMVAVFVAAAVKG
eukprot:g36717.t1